MRAPGFWWESEAGLPARLLSPLGHLSGRIAAARFRREGVKPGVPVICVGNPTVGGAGKTPTVLHLLAWLKAHHRHPAALTRGYGGRLKGPVRVNPAAHRADDVGDEPLLLARSAPTFVSRERAEGAAAAVSAGADVIVMDDGFQNPALAKTLSILVIDGAVGIGNGLCLPAGPLRMPFPEQLDAAAAVLVIGSGDAGERAAEMAAAQGCAVLRGRLAPDAAVAARLIGQNVLAFAGIGRPEKFFATLRGIGAVIDVARPFADHHGFTDAEIGALLDEADDNDLTLVTTEKDMVRLPATLAGEQMARAALALPVRLVLEGESTRKLESLLAAALKKTVR